MRVAIADATNMKASPVSMVGSAGFTAASIFLGSWAGKMDSINCSI